MLLFMSKKSPNSINPDDIRGLFYSLSKPNRYLATVLQGIHQAVIVVYGYAVDHSVPQLFVKFYGRYFKLFKVGEHTADGDGLGFHSVALCGEVSGGALYRYRGYSSVRRQDLTACDRRVMTTRARYVSTNFLKK